MLLFFQEKFIFLTKKEKRKMEIYKGKKPWINVKWNERKVWSKGIYSVFSIFITTWRFHFAFFWSIDDCWNKTLFPRAFELYFSMKFHLHYSALMYWCKLYRWQKNMIKIVTLLFYVGNKFKRSINVVGSYNYNYIHY